MLLLATLLLLTYLLLAPWSLLYTLCHTRFKGDYILSADVLEPSADVPGLDAVGYALYIGLC